MKAFIEWLEDEANGSKVLRCIFVSVAAIFLYVGFTYIPYRLGYFGAGKSIKLTFTFTDIAVITPIFEELAFRFPLYFLARLKIKTVSVLVFAVFSSLLFGYLHGGLANIFIQGVMGFSFCIVFLKCGGLQGNPKKALFSSSCSHSLLNSILFVLEKL